MSNQPDPGFIEFFSADYKSKSQWQALLDAVPYDMSWDRKAAWLLWTLGQHYDAETPWHWPEVLATAARIVNLDTDHPPGSMWAEREPWVNHAETEYWPADPGPVQFSFNSEGR